MTADGSPNLSAPPATLREKIGQLIVVRIGSNLPPILTVTEDEERVARLLQTCPAGGLLLFNGDASTPASLARLQSASAVPLLVAADVERGVGQQVRGCTVFPHAMAFGRLGPHAATAVNQFAETIARECRGTGIQIACVPVADVNTNPRNPIIAIRAYSEDAEHAARLVSSCVEATESAGVFTAAKHFPGHGDTQHDSHDSLPVVDRSLKELRACELLPFQAAIDAGCSLVMTAHVSFPRVDPSGLPATLSPVILRHLLRKEMGFNGVVVSDSLLMAGVRERFATEGELAQAALSAGVDLLLDVREPTAVIDNLCERVAAGSLSIQRIDEAFARVWKLKQRMFLQRNARSESAPREAGADAVSLAECVARGAIEAIGETSAAALPLAAGEPLVAILLKPFETPLDPPEQPLAAALRKRCRDVRYVELGPRADAEAFAAARRLAQQARQLLLAMIVRPAAWHAFGLLPKQSEFVRQLTAERKSVLVSLGVPYALDDYPDAGVRICTYSDVPVSQQALAEFLLIQDGLRN